MCPDLSVKDKSSANKRISEEMPSVMSLIYNRKSRGPRTVPCGTPDSTGRKRNCAPFSTTLWDIVPVKNEEIHSLDNEVTFVSV